MLFGMFVCLLGYCKRTGNEFAYYRRTFQNCMVMSCISELRDRSPQPPCLSLSPSALVTLLLFHVFVVLDTSTGVLHVAEACYI